jgi:hypothetical protein
VVEVLWKNYYVRKIGADGVVSTVGLFYSRSEAEYIVAKLQNLPEKRSCRYEIVD